MSKREPTATRLQLGPDVSERIEVFVLVSVRDGNQRCRWDAELACDGGRIVVGQYEYAARFQVVYGLKQTARHIVGEDHIRVHGAKERSVDLDERGE